MTPRAVAIANANNALTELEKTLPKAGGNGLRGQVKAFKDVLWEYFQEEVVLDAEKLLRG